MRFHILTHTSEGYFFVIAPFTRRARCAAGFLHIQILLAGIVSIAWSMIGLYLYSHETDTHHTLLPWAQYWRLMLFKMALDGALALLNYHVYKPAVPHMVEGILQQDLTRC